jgi:methylmalonyl-CoA/ethylmalonyl-CoA epimerase
MIQRIHHINFIVRDLASAIPAWERILDREVTSRDRLEERGVDIARFDLGQTWIVLVQPTRSGTVPAAHLEQHGEGFFLMSLETDSLQDEVGRLGEAMFDGVERDGLDDWQVRDVDVAGMFGARVQLVESGGS